MEIQTVEEAMIVANANNPSARSATTESALKSLMLASVEGDERAHEQLLRGITPLLRAFFARRLRDRIADVEDLTQEALIAVHTRRQSFDRTRPFTPWLYSIARHKMVDQFRRTAPQRSIDNLDEILVTEGFEESSNATVDISRLLGKLNPKQARVIHDTKISGFSVIEVAARAGISASDVKVSVHRGLKTLSRAVAKSYPFGCPGREPCPQ